jgi:oxygen-independent coproporphyrinogen-3 oxidase
MWGIKLSDLQKLFGDNLKNYFFKTAQPYIKEELLLYNEDVIKLSERGIFVSDGIMSDLMYVD